jgi:hypothetical protein
MESLVQFAKLGDFSIGEGATGNPIGIGGKKPAKSLRIRTGLGLPIAKPGVTLR